MATITFQNVGKVYPDATRAVRDLDLSIDDGELLVLVGPSGCGKTTALRMLAGLEEISEGTVSIDGRVVNKLEPRDRDIAMVFQSYALYPNLSVAENIAYPLRLAKLPKAERASKVRAVARTLRLEEHLDRKPRHLSGGQRQRVAMGRAIVREPRAFLMDEPLSNLDAGLRVHMRTEILRIQQQLGITTVYVTHDQVEAMTLGTRVAVMRQGRLQQVDAPQTLYDAPANLFVAGFIGSPPMNLFEATLKYDGKGYRVMIADQHLELDPDEAADPATLARYRDKTVVVGIRPESLEDSALLDGGPRDGRRLVGDVRFREALGSDALVHFVIPGALRLSRTVQQLAREIEDAVEAERIGQRTEHNVVTGRFDPRSSVEAGAAVEVSVKPEAIRLFDVETGVAIRPSTDLVEHTQPMADTSADSTSPAGEHPGGLALER
jgi:multiple sugar transport system ATP-binding protein